MTVACFSAATIDGTLAEDARVGARDSPSWYAVVGARMARMVVELSILGVEGRGASVCSGDLRRRALIRFGLIEGAKSRMEIARRGSWVESKQAMPQAKKQALSKPRGKYKADAARRYRCQLIVQPGTHCALIIFRPGRRGPTRELLRHARLRPRQLAGAPILGGRARLLLVVADLAAAQEGEVAGPDE